MFRTALAMHLSSTLTASEVVSGSCPRYSLQASSTSGPGPEPWEGREALHGEIGWEKRWGKSSVEREAREALHGGNSQRRRGGERGEPKADDGWAAAAGGAGCMANLGAVRAETQSNSVSSSLEALF